MNRPPILQKIGNTPLVNLPLAEAGISCSGTMLGKLESLNPGGSIKDRSALFMVEYAEKNGLLKDGGVIVEGSSGNQGIALAMIGAVKGYRVIICVPKHTSSEKKATLKSYGAELHVCPDTARLDDPNSYHSEATRIAASIPGSYMPNQYFNLLNPEAHYQWTGPEIYEQTEGKITHFICGMGSCGTISGVGRYLKSKNPAIQIIGIDSAHSLLSAKEPAPYDTEGIGVDVVSEVLNHDVVDKIIPIYDEDSYGTARKYATKGFLVGPSSGAVLFGVEQIAPELKKTDIAVCILADSGRAYLSKLFPAE